MAIIEIKLASVQKNGMEIALIINESIVFKIRRVIHFECKDG